MFPPARCVAASLPVELDSLIAEYLSGDLDALKAFSSVSPSWLAASRPILFRNPTLRTESQLAKLLNTLESSPEVGDCIKGLRISHAVTIPDKLACQLPNLQEIEFFVSRAMFGDWNTCNHSALARLRTVKRICFHHLRILPAHIAQVVCSLPALEQLEIIQCFTPSTGQYSDKRCRSVPFPSRPKGLRLSSLRLLHANDAAPLFLGWLHGLPTLRRVSLQFTPSTNPHIPGFLQSLGTSLESLELSCDDCIFKWVEDDCSAYPSQIDLSANPSLRKLTFGHTYGSELFCILQNAPPNQIDTITFNLSTMFKWNKIDHLRLKSVLSSPRFAGLRELRFIHDEPLPFHPTTTGCLKRADHIIVVDGSRRSTEAETAMKENEAVPYSGVQPHCRVQHIMAADLASSRWIWNQGSKENADD